MISECRPLMLKPCEAVVGTANLCREAVPTSGKLWPFLSRNFTCPFFFTRIRVRYCPYPRYPRYFGINSVLAVRVREEWIFTFLIKNSDEFTVLYQMI